jgi:hypothetical protein
MFICDMIYYPHKRLLIPLALLFYTIAVYSQTDNLVTGFIQPTNAAKPRIWWFWGESITTDHGITKDLEALKRVGFGGVVLYEQVFADRPDALKSLSPEWLERVKFAAAECTRLGLTLEINASNGYVAGGPWITPELGMQRLVFSETRVKGGQAISVILPKPQTKLDFYKDVAVLAFPLASAEEEHVPAITSTPLIANIANVFKPGETAKATIKPASGDGHTMITLDYGTPVTKRSLTYALRPSSKALIIATQVPGNWDSGFFGENMKAIRPVGELESSNDNLHWTKVGTLPGRGYQFESYDKQTIAFPATSARYFRLNLHDWGYNDRYKDENLQVGSISLQGDAKIDQWEKKTGNTNDFPDDDLTPAYVSGDVIDPKRVIDLTNKLSPDGHLGWNAPTGDWVILRFGHTPTGIKTKHGRPEGIGLECDKLSVRAATVQFENYVGKVLAALNGVPGVKLSGVNMDSAEHGTQNWTESFPEEFLRRRGYGIRQFLPAMAGYVVGDRQTTDRFLFDVRRTIADMMSDNYYGTFQKLCHQQGMTLTAEAPGIATSMPSDYIQAKGRTDIPMGEFWMTQENGTIDCKEAASAAHVYGLPVAAAESFTGSMAAVTPAQMKPLADAALALGINRFVVLAYMHQPWDGRKPGVTEDRFYLPYQRHNTWWEYSAGFWNTLARSCQMMQTGTPVVDLLYHLGNDTPLKIATWRLRPVPPAGYEYDVCNDEILLKATVKDGCVLLPGGMSYRVLVLAGSERMTLAAARHIQQLVRNGATVISDGKPLQSASLADGAKAGEQLRSISFIPPGKSRAEASPGQALADLGVPKDFEAIATSNNTILYAHRRSGKDEIYFLSNHSDEPVSFTGAFRVSGLYPQAWNPADGTITGIKGMKQEGSRSLVPLKLEANSSLFIVFRDKPIAGDLPELNNRMPVLQTLTGAWTVKFEPGGGAPSQASFSQLRSWTDQTDPGIRNYSGTATYTQQFTLNSKPAGEIMLDLGKVSVVASVAVNGTNCGTAWKSPFVVDITSAVQAGENKIEIKVANLWTNRLIADAALPESKRISWASFNPYKPGDKLLPSGLLGPVVVRVDKTLNQK